MSDTRTIYLLTQDNIYCSDPQIKQVSDLPLTYLDMSDFDNLNPTRGTVVSGLAGAVSTYEPYDATITLTFKNRQERAEWIQKNSEQVYQIAVANTINQNRVYNKKCAITSFEFVENPYTNGIQTVLTLKLFGKWQSSLTEIEINSGTYSGGTKSYSVDVPVREIGEGANGIAGEPEEDGRVPYTHTAWANSVDGKTGFSIVNDDVVKWDKLTSSSFATFSPQFTEWSFSSGILSIKNAYASPQEDSRVYIKGSSFDNTPEIILVQAKADKPATTYIGSYLDKHAISVGTDWATYKVLINGSGAISLYSVAPGVTFQFKNVLVIHDYSYRGEYTDYTRADSTDPSVYKWGTPRVKKSYAYDPELRYGVTHYVSAIKLDGEHGFVLATKPRNGGLTVNLQSDYNGHKFALESNWPNLITGLSSNFVAYPFTSFTALDQFTMLDGGTVTSYGWNIENNEMPYLYEMFNNVEKYPVSVGAVDQNGALVPIHVYTYTAQDFI